MNTPGLWRNRAFVSLFSAQVISLLGSGVTTIGLTLFVYQMEGGGRATIVIGQALMLRILAFLLFSQPAGVLADRLNRKPILIAADIGRFALLALFPFLTSTWQVYALIFAINALTAFFTPTFEATIPSVVGREHYVKALSLSRVATDVEAIASPALAGLLVAWLGVRWVFWFDAFTYLVSAALVAVVAIPQANKQAAALSIRLFLSEITVGTKILLREPSLRQALLLSLAEATAGAAAIVITVAYVRGILAQSEMTFAFVMAGVGLGSSLTAMVLSRWSDRSEGHALGEAELHRTRHQWAQRALLAGGVVLGGSLLPGMFGPPLLVFAALWIANGAGQALIAIPSATLLAEHTTEGERGKAYAAHFALTHACWLFTYPAAGWAAAHWGAPLAFTAAGIVCWITALVASFLGTGPVAPHTHVASSTVSPD